MEIVIALDKGRHPVLRLNGLRERDVFVASFDEGSAELGIAAFDLLEARVTAQLGCARSAARLPPPQERQTRG